VSVRRRAAKPWHSAVARTGTNLTIAGDGTNDGSSSTHCPTADSTGIDWTGRQASS
jgi:hypothetical protein